MLRSILAALLLVPTTLFADTISHAMGETDVPDDPQRVVVLTNEGTEAVLAIGVTPVGASQSWLGDPWYPHITDAMGDAMNVGKESAINLELVAALEPDLILANKQRHEDIYPQLSAIAPTVVSERLRGDWRRNFELYASALGRDEEGTAALSAFEDNVAALAEKLGDITDEKVSVIRFLPTQIRIYQLDSFSGFILGAVGFDRPDIQNVDEFAIRTGKESIPDMDGDRIFHFTWDTGDGEGVAARDDAMSDPLWQSLSAVKAGRVHEVSDPIWNTAGGIIAANLMLEDIARIYGLE
ncbi:iron-siderophore ABC transporter substrate-binding protein [Cognatiyoonia sp. IB215182]|uniref:ABC transporter substrate-binding protein n=1 Tax=Cognatiyoonia sp. IB215182 TaxID=3097353 RepID=UPI002A106F37|nr:iron-siderophore ABC transporter substrate-binding protein [Cognatiyoonia sp. IB215182]MDX8354820.1 iron-siderophore ABC transporter substrate-binding protein [Cognatiyoonia sp. IB215182]